MKVGTRRRAAAAGMPVIQQHFSFLGVVNRVVVFDDLNSPGRTWTFSFFNAVMLLQPKHETGLPAETNRDSTVHCQVMRDWRGMIATRNIDHGSRHARNRSLDTVPVVGNSLSGGPSDGQSVQYSGSIEARNTTSPCFSLSPSNLPAFHASVNSSRLIPKFR